mmetsp:Transcript_24269/g.50927  ORF Transcript_24269/g.50927 Transcript_24269/m.50927 type:complete len:202 (+) Transcript_24269:164-769(+)
MIHVFPLPLFQILSHFCIQLAHWSRWPNTLFQCFFPMRKHSHFDHGRTHDRGGSSSSVCTVDQDMWDQLLRLLLLHALFLRICKVHGIIIPSPRIILLPPPDPILPRLHAKHRGLLQLLRRARDAIPSGKAQIIQRVGPTFFREFHSEIHDARPWLLHWELYFVRVAAAYPPAWLDLGGYWNWHFLLLVFIIIFLSMRFIR